jgi:CheY-like chemotaxis protein
MDKKKILLIEDDPDNAFLITEEFDIDDTEMEFVLKEDGQEAMDYFNDLNEDGGNEIISQIELILLDLDLPKVKGLDILKFLKHSERFHSIPVVIMSTISDQRTVNEAYENGANGFIAKSVSDYGDKFVKNVKLLKEYYKSRLTEDVGNETDRESQFEDKCKGLIDVVAKRAQMVKDLSCEIERESVVEHSVDVANAV